MRLADFTALEWTLLAGACETVAVKERERAAAASDHRQNARDLLRSARTYERLAERCMKFSKQDSDDRAQPPAARADDTLGNI
ncbi:MAG TPA: hypothetical protein VMG11_14405 [Steroidobacteraceae bacterium]|nr:hypothetical protein [Steroidobacteraceae bacterium]